MTAYFEAALAGLNIPQRDAAQALRLWYLRARDEAGDLPGHADAQARTRSIARVMGQTHLAGADAAAVAMQRIDMQLAVLGNPLASVMRLRPDAPRADAIDRALAQLDADLRAPGVLDQDEVPSLWRRVLALQPSPALWVGAVSRLMLALGERATFAMLGQAREALLAGVDPDPLTRAPWDEALAKLYEDMVPAIGGLPSALMQSDADLDVERWRPLRGQLSTVLQFVRAELEPLGERTTPAVHGAAADLLRQLHDRLHALLFAIDGADIPEIPISLDGSGFTIGALL